MKTFIVSLIVFLHFCGCSQNKTETTKLADPFLIDSWSIIKGTDNNKPFLARANSGLSDFKGMKNYGYRVVISLQFKQPDEDGFPDGTENFELFGVEDSLDSYLVHSKLALPVLVITGNGKRDYIFYAQDIELIKPKISIINSKIESYDIQFHFEHDEVWSLFKKYVK